MSEEPKPRPDPPELQYMHAQFRLGYAQAREEAVEALREAGWTVTEPVTQTPPISPVLHADPGALGYGAWQEEDFEGGAYG
jgi:hypothetical protein